MKAFFNVATASLISCLALTACTVHKTEAPAISGPSDLALSTRMEANPDTIGQDGGSQSSIRVFANGPDGKPLAGVTFRVDMEVNGVPQDFGALSARSIVTGSDGVARVIFTAPAADPAGLTGTCLGLAGTCVTIVATPSSTGFGTVAPQTVTLRLVPLGVILPPAETPTPAFTITPTPVNFNIPATFDASTSCGGTVVGGRCTSASAITSYAWDFGDGATATGRVVNHTFVSGTQSSTSFNVTLTVTNDRGLSASTTQTISVGASPAPTGTFTFSPTSPQPNQTVFFNAESVRPSAGHTIASYAWSFGDGGTASGVVVTHAFTSIGTFTVTLTVTDDVGQKLTVTASVPVAVGTSGAPFAAFTGDPPSPVVAGTTVRFDASASTATAGSRIVTYQWQITGDATVYQQTSPIFNYSFPAPAGNKVVTLTVIDNQGRTGTASTTYTVR